jgi:8-oxo-dGTP pyrophosphatase MutT (NUDIX family)
MLHRLWSGVLAPLLRRPPRFQVAALCHRTGADGGVEILLVTSRDTGRWVLPKGWPEAGKGAAEMAAQEAWEEAGVRPARIGQAPVGRYSYAKRMRGGVPVETVVDVFPVSVDRLEDDFPEAYERSRAWKTPQDAAAAVEEDSLAALLRALPPLTAGAEG